MGQPRLGLKQHPDTLISNPIAGNPENCKKCLRIKVSRYRIEKRGTRPDRTETGNRESEEANEGNVSPCIWEQKYGFEEPYKGPQMTAIV